MARPRLTDLPNEILLQVIEDLPDHDLKNARFISKNVSKLAATLLFRHMILVPFSDCLRSFTTFIKASDLAQHVHTVTYDARWRSAIRVKPGSPTSPYRRHLLGNDFKRDAEEQNEIVLLSHCLESLPNLYHIIVKAPGQEEIALYPGRRLHQTPVVTFLRQEYKQVLLELMPSYWKRMMKGKNGMDLFVFAFATQNDKYRATRVVLYAGKNSTRKKKKISV